MTLRISGIPGSMTNEEFIDMLEPFGSLYSAHIVFDRITAKSKRFGFAEFGNIEDGVKAIKTLDNTSISERQVLKVQQVKKE